MSYWSEIVQKFDLEGYHCMEDVPEVPPFPTVDLCKLSEFAVSRWSNGLTAEAIVLEMDQGTQADVVMWVREPLTTDQLTECASLRADTIFSILTIESDKVIMYTGQMREVVKDYPFLIHVRQLPALQVLIGQQPVMPSYVRHVLPHYKETNTVYVFFATNGPQLTDVRAFEGSLDAVESTICVQEANYCFCRRPRSSKPVVVADGVKLLWLRRTFIPSVKYDLTSEQYYSKSMGEYSAWSFAVHQKQVSQVLELLPEGATVVAPGDGIGVCARLWKGPNKVISGDSQFSVDSLVQREPFLATMMRGRKVGGSVLILSYVWSLMSDEEREVARYWPGQVFLIDAKTVCPLPYYQHGPGIFSNRRQMKSQKLAAPESPLADRRVLFSENLLRLTEISDQGDNPSIRYWQAMRPLGRRVPGAIVVVHDLVELVQRFSELSGSLVYLSSIGRIFEESETMPSGLNKVCYMRTVYELPFSSPLISYLRENFHFARLGSRCFVVFPHIPHVSYKNYLVEGHSQKLELRIVPYGSRGQESRSIKFKGRMLDCLFIEAPQGVISWSCRSPFVRMLAKIYFEFVFVQEWKLRLTSKDPRVFDKGDYVGDVNERIGAYPIGQLVERLRKVEHWVVDPRVSPLGWRTETGRTVLQGMELSSEDFSFLTSLDGLMSSTY